MRHPRWDFLAKFALMLMVAAACVTAAVAIDESLSASSRANQATHGNRQAITDAANALNGLQREIAARHRATLHLLRSQCNRVETVKTALRVTELSALSQDEALIKAHELTVTAVQLKLAKQQIHAFLIRLAPVDCAKQIT